MVNCPVISEEPLTVPAQEHQQALWSRLMGGCPAQLTLAAWHMGNPSLTRSAESHGDAPALTQPQADLPGWFSMSVQCSAWQACAESTGWPGKPTQRDGAYVHTQTLNWPCKQTPTEDAALGVGGCGWYEQGLRHFCRTCMLRTCQRCHWCNSLCYSINLCYCLLQPWSTRSSCTKRNALENPRSRSRHLWRTGACLLRVYNSGCRAGWSLHPGEKACLLRRGQCLDQLLHRARAVRVQGHRHQLPVLGHLLQDLHWKRVGGSTSTHALLSLMWSCPPAWVWAAAEHSSNSWGASNSPACLEHDTTARRPWTRGMVSNPGRGGPATCLKLWAGNPRGTGHRCSTLRLGSDTQHSGERSTIHAPGFRPSPWSWFCLKLPEAEEPACSAGPRAAPQAQDRGALGGSHGIAPAALNLSGPSPSRQGISERNGGTAWPLTPELWRPGELQGDLPAGADPRCSGPAASGWGSCRRGPSWGPPGAPEPPPAPARWPPRPPHRTGAAGNGTRSGPWPPPPPAPTCWDCEWMTCVGARGGVKGLARA